MAIKVVQWATGMVGRQTLEEIIQHPDLDLVGLYVYSTDKNGVDAGDIVGLPKTGVLGTRRLEDILALDADMVIHTPKLHPTSAPYDGDVIRLLEAGKNVISTCDYYYPAAEGSDYAARLEAACQTGRSRLFGTGLNPGFALERLALMLTTATMSVESITVGEYFDASETPSAQMVCDVMGIGRPVASFDPQGPIAQLLKRLFMQSVRLVEAEMGVAFERIAEDHQVIVAEHDEQIAATFIKKGTVAGMRWSWSCFVDGRPFLTFIMRWIGSRLLSQPEWASISDHWTVDIVGKPSLRVNFELLPADDGGRSGLTPHILATYQSIAAFAMRSIPDVLAAPPGLVRVPSFGQFRPGYSRRAG